MVQQIVGGSHFGIQNKVELDISTQITLKNLMLGKKKDKLKMTYGI